MAGKDTKEVLGNLETQVDEFVRWMDGLSKLDRMNFEMLINMPNGAAMIEKCPDPVYLAMGAFALALKKAGELKEKPDGN